MGPVEMTRPWPTEPVDLLRKEFTVDSPVISARLYATALGSYVAHLNGVPVGDQILAPGWTDYQERVPYQTFDVTNLVHPGQNAIGAYLAPGWYLGPLIWFQITFPYGNTPPVLRAQLRLEHADGRVEWVHTDRSWKATVSGVGA